MEKLKLAGAWSGVLEVELEEWTVPMLRKEVANRLDCGPESINLIFAGKVLKDGFGTQKLIQLGFKNNAKILVSRLSLDQSKSLMAEEERISRLSRLKAAATSLAKRHADGSLLVDNFSLELENQSGESVQLGSEADQQSIMMGLMLHTKAKELMRRQKYKDALEVLAMGEEAFSLCNPKAIELIDNGPILQVDMVWCYFMLRDISWLSVAGIHLAKAREGFKCSHGKESHRVRLLQGDRQIEIALHLRLDLLEGVVAYHSGQFEKSRNALTSAQAKYLQLQVPDEALSLLMSMGYRECDAKRALRITNHDVESAVDFLVEDSKRQSQETLDNVQRWKEIEEQRRYGMTPLRKAVNLKRLNELVSTGFERELAAEALRRNENDTQNALDDLTNPETNSSLQLDIESRKRKRPRQAADAASEAPKSTSFPRATAAAAVRADGTKERAPSHLHGQHNPNATIAADGNANSSVSMPNNVGANSLSAEGGAGDSSGIGEVSSAEGGAEDPSGVGEDASDVSEVSSADAGDPSGTGEVSSAEGGDGEPSSEDEVEGSVGDPSNEDEVEERDMEVENELAGEIERGDALSDYDIEITKEGEVISEYLALLMTSDSIECPTIKLRKI